MSESGRKHVEVALVGSPLDGLDRVLDLDGRRKYPHDFELKTRHRNCLSQLSLCFEDIVCAVTGEKVATIDGQGGLILLVLP